MRKSLEYQGGNERAIIVLHEIYGINDFIKKICRQYHTEGYDVFCPDLYGNQKTFSYFDAEEAYHTYRTEVGFDVYHKIDSLAAKLKQTYPKVAIIGFSVGATLAWRCSENSIYDGIICCYGSRIRDYLNVEPGCPVLLIFAEQDSFDAAGIVSSIRHKEMITAEVIDGKHGFADCYGETYCQRGAEILNRLRKDFLTGCT